MSDPIYPTIRSAVYSAICDHLRIPHDEAGDPELERDATELTDRIMEALGHVEGARDDGPGSTGP